MKNNITLKQMKKCLGSLRSLPRTLAVLGVLGSVSFGSSMMAAMLRVPADYPTIQVAVDAAAPSGDEIGIAPGVYQQQVLITQKKLTLTGSAGTILEAWTGMNWRPGGPSYDLIWITTNADVVIRNIEFDGRRLAASMPNSSALLEAVVFFGASGRVENCVFRSFRGVNNLATPTTPPRGGWGLGLVAFNPASTGSGVTHVQVRNCNFSDNAFSMAFAGDFGPVGMNNPALLRTTFTVQGNTITGVGPSSDYQLGMDIYNGASGVIKHNRIIEHCSTSGGYWSAGIYARPVGVTIAPLKPIRIEENAFVGNQKHLLLIRGDNTRLIDNIFDGTGSVLAPDGIWVTGNNVLTAVNLFTNLSIGVHLAANNSQLPAGSGVAVNPSLLANQFCGVSVPVQVDSGVILFDELGSEYCPWAPESLRDLTCSPECGLPGTTVTLSGTNITDASAVLFNGLSATFTTGADPDRLITATVPAHATTGPIKVITPQGNITSLTPFTVPVPLAMSRQPGGLVQLSWCADACDLLLDSTPDLASPDWQPVATSPSVGTESVTWTGPLGSGAQFFRLRQPAGTDRR